MDRTTIIKHLAVYGFYGYPVEKAADLLHMTNAELKKKLEEDQEFHDAFYGSLGRIKRQTLANLIESTFDKKEVLKKPVKVREGRVEKVVQATEEIFVKGDVSAMKFILTNLDPDNFSLDGKEAAHKAAPVTINILPVATPDAPIVTTHLESDEEKA